MSTASSRGRIAGRRRTPGLIGLLPILAIIFVGACALPGALPGAAKPPTAEQILHKPEQSSMKDAHLVVEGHLSQLKVTGEGGLVLKPVFAMELELTAPVSAASSPSVGIIQIGNDLYVRLGSTSWTRSTATRADPLGETSTGARLVGEESLAQGRSWHVAATRDRAPFEIWVRKSDGYPLRTRSKDSTTGIEMTANFDRFNTGNTVSPPAALSG